MELHAGSRLQEAMQGGELLTAIVERSHLGVHIHMQQRNGRRAWTKVQGLPNQVRLPKSGQILPVDFRKLTKAIKRDFQTNVLVLDNTELGKVLVCQGDIRREIRNFLIDE